MLSLKQVIEALVFASPKPLSIKEIQTAIKSAVSEAGELPLQEYGVVTVEDIASLLAELNKDYAETQRAFQLVDQVNGWALVTVNDAAHWVRQLYPEAKPTRLSGPALETLAIIAYRQPVTRADIEAVRGVAVDGVMQVLLDRSLVKIAGRADVPGRPLLYETTEYFLQHFGLKAVGELPNSDELRRVKLPTAPIPEAPVTEAEKPADEPQQSAEETAEPEQPEAEPEPEQPEAETVEAETVEAETVEAAVEVDEAEAQPESDRSV